MRRDLRTTEPTTRGGGRRRPRRRRTSALALLLAVPLAACGGRESTPPAQGVVLFLLDTVRADHLGCYGYERPTSPSIDALAAEGTVFEHAIAHAPWTLPSAAALLTGRYPAMALDGGQKLTGSLVRKLQVSGVRTAAVTEGGFVSRYFGFDQGFDSYRQEEGAVRLLQEGEQPPQPEDTERTAEQVFAAAQAWLEDNADAPFFLLVHTYEPHTPYTEGAFAAGMDQGRIKEAFKIQHLVGLREGRIEMTAAEHAYATALYDGDIRETDRLVGEFLAFLAERGLDETTAVFVTSDHGEDLGEGYATGAYDHGHSLRDNLLHVPLVVHVPWRDRGRPRVEEQVRLVDVLPTVCDLLGVPLPTDLPGRSLLPLLAGREAEPRLAFSAETKRGPARISVRDGRYKLIRVVGPAPGTGPHHTLPDEVLELQLYDLEADPDETRNLAYEHPEIVERLAGTLDAWYRYAGSAGASRALETDDEEVRARLRALGYGE